jgi:quinol-cytochrome oxidoreductase complex cytochrome b subunit
LAGAAPRQCRAESEEAKPAAERKSMPFMPNFLRKDMAMWIISLNVLALLASVFPWALGKQYDSLAPAPMGIHPEWYFMSPFEMLKLLGMVRWLQGEPGEIAGILLFTLGIVLWILIPFYDKNKESGRRARPHTISGCWRCSRFWPLLSSATGPFGKKLS